MRTLLLFLASFTVGAGSILYITPDTHTPIVEKVQSPKITQAQMEKDEIYNLVAYSLVLKNWQTENDKPGRGHNIGAVLVDPKGKIVFGNLNCNFVNGNTTQHAEVRTITTYLKNTDLNDLKGYSIYTTLEPCAMCSGMMTQSSVARTVYGQTDPAFGKALERLQLDSRALPNGYSPYPRPVRSEPSQSPVRIQLDVAYLKRDMGLTAWLRTEEAHEIYKAANARLKSYKCSFPENEVVLEAAKKFVEEWKLEE